MAEVPVLGGTSSSHIGTWSRKERQAFQSSNATLGLVVLKRPRMNVFGNLVVEPPYLVLLRLR